MRRVARVALLAVALAAASPASARAEEASAETQRPPPRPVPDLDGRPAVGPDPTADALLWIPRILTGPLYVVTEYLIRVPLGALVTELERAGVIDWLFAGGGPITVLPTMFFEFGLSPSVGLYAAWDEALFEENRVSLHAATWGEDWLRGIVRDRVRVGEHVEVALRFEARRRPDQILEGFGHDATQVPRARFGVELLEGRVEMKLRAGGRSALELQAGYRSAAFRDRGWGDDPSITGRGLPAPAGFDSGYELLFFRFDLLIDTHTPERELTRGRFRLRAIVEQNAAFGGFTQNDPRLFASFIRWGGEIAGSTDFLGRGRVFMLRLQTMLVSPIPGGGPIPFYELPDAGGHGPLPGFITGQLRGASTLGATLEYNWPVYALLDGFMQIGVGNAFGVHYEGFEFDRLRLAWAIGIAPRFEGEHLIEISFGLGTETFENGGGLSQARLVVGARHGL